MRKDPVSPELRQIVFERDRDAVERELFGGSTRWYTGLKWFGDRLYLGDTLICPAVIIDRKQLGKCKGRWTLDHVKDEARLGVRASSDPAHLISLCEGHTENGMIAGRQWNTSHRPELRKYLALVRAGEEVVGHVVGRVK